MAPIKETQQAAVAFTPELDRRICEGYLGDRQTMLEELDRVGITEEAIVKRGEVLGLSASFLSKCHEDGVTVAVRECLSCEQPFVSLGRQNRLCKRCRNRG